MTLYIDYAWTKPNAQAVYNAGYRGVMRYLSNDSAKDLSITEAAALHKAGLGIGLVWETTADRARAGEAAGKYDAALANKKADALGFPKSCPIFYAVDYDALVNDITPYFIGIGNVTGRPVGVYGSYYVVKAMMAAYANYGWQTMAWSGGNKLAAAHLFQNLNHSWPIAGVSNSAWDENVLQHSFPLWTPTTPQEITLSTAEVQEIKDYVGKAVAGIPNSVWAADVIPSPDLAADNPNWTPASYLRWTLLGVQHAQADALAANQKATELATKLAEATAAVADVRTLIEAAGGDVTATVLKATQDALAQLEITLKTAAAA